MTISTRRDGSGDRGADSTRAPKPEDAPRCGWCRRPLPQRDGPGRPRRWCRQGCRQQAYIARRFADDHGLGDDDLIVSRATLDDLLGRLYCLQAGVVDVRRDLAVDDGADEVRLALDWLLENAEPLDDAWLEPKQR